MDLIPTLRRMGRAANRKFPSLNHGGCCVYASEVGRRLEDAGLTVRVVSGRPWAWEADQSPTDKVREVLLKNNRNVNSKHNWSSNGIDFWHVAVQFMHDGKWYSCDSDSVHRGIDRFGKRRLMHKAPGSGFTVNEAIGFAEEVEGWNSCFNRTDIPAVKNLIDKYLSPLLTTQVQ